MTKLYLSPRSDIPEYNQGGGWRIEKRYTPKVLIGNWREEREKFTKGNYDHNSTYRHDFKSLPSHRPDTLIRRQGQLKNEGYGKIVFRHGGAQDKYSNNMISWYDEHYNRRKREPWDQLPELRTWDSNTLGWLPERSDHPMRGASTNFGLYEKILGRARDAPVNTSTDYNTTYTSSYTQPPPGAFKISRFATHRDYPNEVQAATSTAEPRLETAGQLPDHTQALAPVAC